MGYQRKSLQILGGGWNALPSVDKTPITDYLLAQNWRADQAGRLVSRYGYIQKFSIAGAGVAHSAGQHGGVEGDYYVAANASGGTNGVYYNFGSTPIATGFDGNRVGFAAMNGYEWVMNRGKQGRHSSGTGWQSWNIAAPTASAGVSTASTPSASGSATFSYTLQGSSSYLHYLTVNGRTYSFQENGYGASQLPLLISLLAQSDPDVTVTYSGSGSSVTITPIPQNTLVKVSGSDGNGSVNIGTGAINQLPNGVYTFYYTFASQDSSLESNPGPVSASISLTNQGLTISGLQTSSDSRVQVRNIYAAGGNLGQAYLVATINDNTSTSATIAWSDLDVTNNGVAMPTDNDPPPAASGLAGPYYSRLYAWSSVGNPNRVWYTPQGKPQYWPGSSDNQVGNWFDVGAEAEAVLWCTQHTNVLVIYKERSVWRLIGDPESDTSVLEQVHDSLGIAGAFAVVSAGQYDYFVSSQGLHRYDLTTFTDMAGNIRPLFTQSIVNTGRLTPPGGIANGSQYLSDSLYAYALALGYAAGKLYIGYTENSSPTSYCLAVYDEATERWFYDKNSISGATQFQGFFYDGVVMCGLTGAAAGAALGLWINDFRNFYAADPSTTAIECVYQSHYEDAGLPDNQKNWLEIVVDCEIASGDTATVYAAYDNGSTALASVGTIAGAAGRQQKGFALGAGAGVLAKNISVAIDCPATHGPVAVHNVHLYFYAEARLAMSASTIPVDLGVARVKQVKELELDIDSSNGNVAVTLFSDLPGNALASRQTPTVTSAGRAVFKYPFSAAEGYLWKLQLAAASGPFRLYSARLLTRAMGTYVEAYEAANGFVWDSMEQSFDSGITHIPKGYAIALAANPIKRAREIRLEIDCAGAVTVNLLTDLPGNSQASRYTGTVAATGGRRYVSLPLAAGFSAPIEGRLFRLEISGSSKFILYGASIEVLPVGVYLEAYETAAGAVWDSRELDFGSAKTKEARELELDIESSGSVTYGLYYDLPNYAMGSQYQTATISATSGRQKILIPLTAGAAPYSYPLGRMWRLILSSASAYRLYGARLKVREVGTYLTGDEAGATPAAVWDSTPLDFETERVKDFKKLELDLQTDGAVTVTVFTDQSGTMAQQFSTTLNTGGNREALKIALTPGIRGRLVQVEVAGAGARLFAGRAWWRPLNEPQAQWQWTALPIEPTPPAFQWAPLPVLPTEPQYFWAKILSVEETSDVWNWVDLDFSVSG